VKQVRLFRKADLLRSPNRAAVFAVVVSTCRRHECGGSPRDQAGEHWNGSGKVEGVTLIVAVDAPLEPLGIVRRRSACYVRLELRLERFTTGGSL
jgi:hypothetical protein